MKYWSSSRVGAVPQQQGAASKQPKDRPSKYGRKKGITMEDLKKQTALRLAQEQKPDFAYPTSPAHPQLTGPLPTGGGGGADNRATNYGGLHSLERQPGGGVYGPPPSNVAAVASENVRPSPHPFDSSSNAYGRSLPPPPPLPPPLPPAGVVVDPQLSMSSSASNTSMYLSADNSSKLPHGLTVNELKEMTKARLQAEASTEPPDTEGGPTSSGLSPAPPLPENRDQAPPEQQVLLVGGISPLPPSFHHQQPPQQQQRVRTHSQVSRDAWSQDGGGSARGGAAAGELWETGSVSTVASDYLGSESAYGGGGGGVGSYCSGGETAPSPSPYGLPSNSNNGGPVSHFSDVPPPESVALPGVMSSSGFYFSEGPSSSSIPNRRRAATLSPRQGLGFLDERHEVHHHHQYPPPPPPQDDNSMPVLPSFASPMNNQHQYRVCPSAAAPSSSSRHHSSGLPLGSFNSSYSNCAEPNRARTSSAVSLPAMSCTDEEFASVYDQQQPLPPSFHRIPSGISTLREEAPSPSVTGLADVFRESPLGFHHQHHGASSVHAPPGLGGPASDHYSQQRVSAPSGLGLRSGLGSVDSFGGGSGNDMADPRGRAATWAGSTAESMFGPGLFGGGQQQEAAALCDDLATILQLSVGGGDPKNNEGGSASYPPPGL